MSTLKPKHRWAKLHSEVKSPSGLEFKNSSNKTNSEIRRDSSTSESSSDYDFQERQTNNIIDDDRTDDREEERQLDSVYDRQKDDRTEERQLDSVYNRQTKEIINERKREASTEDRTTDRPKQGWHWLEDRRTLEDRHSQRRREDRQRNRRSRERKNENRSEDRQSIDHSLDRHSIDSLEDRNRLERLEERQSRLEDRTNYVRSEDRRSLDRSEERQSFDRSDSYDRLAKRSIDRLSNGRSNDNESIDERRKSQDDEMSDIDVVVKEEPVDIVGSPSPSPPPRRHLSGPTLPTPGSFPMPLGHLPFPLPLLGLANPFNYPRYPMPPLHPLHIPPNPYLHPLGVWAVRPPSLPLHRPLQRLPHSSGVVQPVPIRPTPQNQIFSRAPSPPETPDSTERSPRPHNGIRDGHKRKLSKGNEKLAVKIGFSRSEIDKITTLPMDEFQDFCNDKKLSEDAVNVLKDIRRRGKNKIAAQNCRKRKIDMIDQLKDTLVDKKQEKRSLRKQHDLLSQEKRDWADKFQQLQSRLLRGHGKDPNMFEIQVDENEQVTIIEKRREA